MKIYEIREQYPKIADLALEYFDEEFFEEETREKFEGYYEEVTVDCAFKWDQSPQGYDFWDSIYNGNYEKAKKLNPELFDKHPSSKFKIGDKVRCIEGIHKGSGWKLNKEYIVDEITRGSIGYVYFPKGRSGVYEDSVELVSDKVPEYIEACINYAGYYIKGKIYKVIDKNFTNCTAVITNFDNEYKAGTNLYVDLKKSRNWKPSTKEAYDAQIQTKEQFNVGDWVVFDINKAPDHLITQVWDKSYVLKVDKVFADNLEFNKETAIKAGMKNIIFSCSNSIRCFRKALPHEIHNEIPSDSTIKVGDWVEIVTLNSKSKGRMTGKIGHIYQVDKINNNGHYYSTDETYFEGSSLPLDCIKKVNMDTESTKGMDYEEIPVTSKSLSNKSLPTESFSFYKEYKPIKEVKVKQVKISSIKQFKFN